MRRVQAQAIQPKRPQVGEGGEVKILVACEYSGIVRDAFIQQGHDAFSCDLLPSESDFGPHYQCDVLEVLNTEGWDMLIAFPPCTHLASSGARWFKDKRQKQAEALELVRVLMYAPIPYIAVENPVGVISTVIRKTDQIIQPWMFGHGETKKTCLWLKNLPKLVPTNIVEGRENRIHRMSPGGKRYDRSKERSRTYQGIADAMADQWSNP
jgi:hypothetical protein